MKAQLSVVLVTHSFTTGQPDLLIDFLRKRVPDLLVIRHPFSYAKDIASQIKFYKHGIKVKETKFYPLKIGEFSLYLKDFVLTLIIALRFRRKFSLYIGVDCLNAFVGILLRKVGYVEKVVLYTIDLPVKRFNNPILNVLYHKLDVYCAKRCDSIWDLSPRMEAVRAMFGWTPTKEVTTLVVPAVFKNTMKCASSSINPQRMVFVGHLKESQGLQLVIEAFPEILEKVPSAKLVIIGTGPYEEKLRQMVQKIQLEGVIEFLGYIEDHREIEKTLCECGIGLAPYAPDLFGITTYADPMKPKIYMACGLPVIITNVPWVASQIGKKGAGLVIRYAKEDFIQAALKLMTNYEFYLNCRKRALELSSEFTPEAIFSKVFANLTGDVRDHYFHSSLISDFREVRRFE
jgi:glycosyltransferase involved in cell wall biosynthesis